MHNRNSDALNFNYPVDKLIEKLKENRNAHEAIYKEAMEGYLEELGRLIGLAENKFIDNLKKVREKFDKGEIEKISLMDLIDDVTLNIVKPEEFLKYYDEALAMLEFTADETIVLPRQEFSQLVLDNWDWKDQFTGSNSRYAKSLGG